MDGVGGCVSGEAIGYAPQLVRVAGWARCRGQAVLSNQTRLQVGLYSWGYYMLMFEVAHGHFQAPWSGGGMGAEAMPHSWVRLLVWIPAQAGLKLGSMAVPVSLLSLSLVSQG